MNVSLFQDINLHPIGVMAQSEDISEFVANALRFVIQNVFANISNTFVLTHSTDGGPIEFWLNNVMTKIFGTWSFMAVQLVVMDSKTEHLEVPGRRYCNLILIDSYKSLERANIAKYNENYDSLEYYFIFLQIRDIWQEREMSKIFNYCFENYWLHCNVMVQTSRGEILVYTYFPFRENHCFHTQPVVINRFIKGRFESVVMFPDKLKNLNKCPLKLTTWNTPPFVTNQTDYFFPEYNISGFEIYTLITISHIMNFTLDVEMIPTDTYEKNSTIISIPMEMLKNRQTNITMGYLRHTALRQQTASPSYVTYYLTYVAVILRKHRQFQSVGMLTFPFDRTTWILLIISCLISFILNFLYGKKRVLTNFQMYRVLIGTPIEIEPISFRKRLHVMSMILTCFVLRQIYQSLLFHLFSSNFYEQPPVTLNALVTEGYKAFCSINTANLIPGLTQIHDGSLPLFLFKSSNETLPLYYLEMNPNEKYVAISVFEFILFYAFGVMTRGNALQILPIHVNDQHIGFYYVKHSFLVERFDYYILHFKNAGLLYKWKQRGLMHYKVGLTNGNSYGTIFIVNLQQLFGVFVVMMFLHSVSFVVFGLELLSKKIKCLQNLFK